MVTSPYSGSPSINNNSSSSSSSNRKSSCSGGGGISLRYLLETIADSVFCGILAGIFLNIWGLLVVFFPIFKGGRFKKAYFITMLVMYIVGFVLGMGFVVYMIVTGGVDFQGTWNQLWQFITEWIQGLNK